eukprot:TRINITY_DN34050_c0_g1_i2.p2 TRINITY_DN34050_c0_g1~~TRINITY_DN34050_c0_g1_i2.p2  ORF type:complete len:315 (-),score=62.18 TRINITY_DN34050_c0_g1_i2:79-1023(-)
MPFETVNETYVRQRQVRICARCRREIPSTVKHKQAYTTAGSVAGSLGTSVGGSMLLGSVLGPVGSIAGAIGGAMVGGRAGATASEAACNAVDSTSGDLCEACKSASSSKPAGHQNFGGGRLGDTAGPSAPVSQAQGGYRGAADAAEPSVQQRVGSMASTAGESLSGAASAVGSTLSTAGTAVGSGFSSAGNWVRSSFSGGGGGDGSTQTSSSSGAGRGSGESWKAFSGSGHALGSTGAAAPCTERPPAAAAPQRPPAAVSRLVRPAQAAAEPAAAAAQPQEPEREQLLDDEALARHLQEQFDREARDAAGDPGF